MTESNTGGWDSTRSTGVDDAADATSYEAYDTSSYDTPGVPGVEAADPELEAKVIEIERTREEMTGTVEAIGDRLDPANIVGGAKDAVRDATVGKVEDMTNQAQEFIGDATTSVQQAGGGLLDTVKTNPVPALMVGVGLGWLWMNRNGGASRTSISRPDNSWRSNDAWREGDGWRGRRPMYGDPSWDRIRGTGLSDRAGDVADAVGDRMETVGDRFDTAGQRMGEMGDHFADSAGQYADNARQIVTDNILAAGVVAAALGAAVGMLLPATDTERRVIGDAGSKVIDAAQSTASDAMSDMESEAKSTKSSTTA
jgi:ElaB/YqjD/DUF883 family membrane-anchored ribosome-binding protein